LPLTFNIVIASPQGSGAVGVAIPGIPEIASSLCSSQ
jgi:hypothetical protein